MSHQTKVLLAGDWEKCHNQIFVGLSDSYEQFYQATRRCWRFGQKNTVKVHVITSHLENAVLKNIRRKESDHKIMIANMLNATKEMCLGGNDPGLTDLRRKKQGTDWIMHEGDAVEVIKQIPSNSVHYTIFSPPFASLFTYSATDRDMGNCRNDTEFLEHFRFLTSDLFRVLMPGRLLSFHCANIPTTKHATGQIGIVDFRGKLIREFEEAGFIYCSEVLIWKDPVTQMQRTKSLGLLHKQVKKDSCMSRQGLPDYLVTMRKPGDNPEPVRGRFERYHGEDAPASSNGNRITRDDGSTESSADRFSIDVWQRYASPVWMDIKQGDTLQRESAREQKR